MPSNMSQSREPRVRRKTFNDNSSDSERDDVSSVSSSSSNSGDEGDSLLQKLPTLPDLRFEQSYLSTIRDFLHEDEHPEHEGDKEKTDYDQPDHHHKVSITKSKARDSHEVWLGNLRVEWFPILYVTVRDQLLSPLVQGAVWGVAGILFTQVRQFMAAKAQSSSSKPVNRSFRRR